MSEAVVFSLASVFVVSLISFAGVLTIAVAKKKLNKVLLYFIAFSAGALFGDAIIHLLPEAAADGFTLPISMLVLSGIMASFIVEKLIHYTHCHHLSDRHVHPFAYMNLFGDGVHNFIDGIIIAASYLVSVPVGIATTIAVIFHEIPQEIGDFGVLIHGGFKVRKALLLNFLTALTAVLGAVVAIILASSIEGITTLLLAFAAGNFIYIAGADLIPELHKKFAIKSSILQFLVFALGIAVMYALLMLEL